MSLTPAQRRLRASIAARTRWAREADRTAAMAPARAGRIASYERQVDPDRTLDPAERARRVALLESAHMRRMSLAAARKTRGS